MPLLSFNLVAKVRSTHTFQCHEYCLRIAILTERLVPCVSVFFCCAAFVAAPPRERKHTPIDVRISG